MCVVLVVPTIHPAPTPHSRIPPSPLRVLRGTSRSNCYEGQAAQGAAPLLIEGIKIACSKLFYAAPLQVIRECHLLIPSLESVPEIGGPGGSK